MESNKYATLKKKSEGLLDTDANAEERIVFGLIAALLASLLVLSALHAVGEVLFITHLFA